MIEVLHEKAELGGTSSYQAQVEKNLVQKFEDALNTKHVSKVHSVNFYRADNEIGLIGVIEVETGKSSKKGA